LCRFFNKVLVSIKPKGTFVADPLIVRSYLKVISLTIELKLMGLNLETVGKEV
jgi:hypothetical protein